MEKFIPDPFFNHRIRVRQPETGYRFSMDPFLLCFHIRPRPGDRILDIGCGCAIMPLLLGFRYRDAHILGVEIQEELAGFARSNVEDNGLENRIRILHRDIRSVDLTELDGPLDIIVSNPPYKKKDTGRLNPDPGRALARHEITLSLPVLYSTARRLLKPGGRITIVFPAQRLPEIFTAMSDSGFAPEWLRFIHIRKNEPARLVLASAIKKKRGTFFVRPPLVVTRESGEPTQEYLRMFAARDVV